MSLRLLFGLCLELVLSVLSGELSSFSPRGLDPKQSRLYMDRNIRGFASTPPPAMIGLTSCDWLPQRGTVPLG